MKLISVWREAMVVRTGLHKLMSGTNELANRETKVRMFLYVILICTMTRGAVAYGFLGKLIWVNE